MEVSLLVMLVIIILDGLIHKVDLLDTFINGVKAGLGLFQTLFPNLLAFMVITCLLENSGIIGWLTACIQTILPIPSSLLGLALFRSVSSQASLSFLIDIFTQYGPDSLIGLQASLMQGATDTTLYVTSLYFSCTQIKNTGYIVWLCLFLDFCAIMLAYFLAIWVY